MEREDQAEHTDGGERGSGTSEGCADGEGQCEEDEPQADDDESEGVSSSVPLDCVDVHGSDHTRWSKLAQRC
jgi:hypothetical protein